MTRCFLRTHLLASVGELSSGPPTESVPESPPGPGHILGPGGVSRDLCVICALAHTTHTLTHAHTRMHSRIHSHTHAHTRTRTLDLRTHARTHQHTRMYTHALTNTRARTHTHTHTDEGKVLERDGQTKKISNCEI